MSNDEDLYFTFDLGDNDNINAEFELEENDSIDCLFEINAAGTVWGSISGTLSDQEDLQAALDLKADKSELESDMAAVDEAISNVQTVIENNYNTLDSKIDNVQSDLSGDISTLENTLNNRIDATNQTVAELSTTVADNNTAINNRVDGIVDSFDGDISNLETAIQNEAATRANNDTLLQGDINTLRNDLTSEISNRTSADDTLQDNIDNIQNTIDNYGDIISYNASDFATAAQGLLAESALQPNDNISELNNDAGYLTDADLSGYLRNTATGSNSLTIDGIASNKTNSINIGAQSTVNNYSIALGYYATASGSSSMALGLTANAFAQNAIQIGSGANSTANTLQVRSYTLLDTSTGLIPDARISSNIARSSDIPTFTDEQIAALNSGANTANIGQIATNTGNISSLSNTVTSNYNTLDGRITSEVNTLNGAITGEATNRQNADNALQTQIDAITSASDVFDIVGTYAELQAYDISTVPVNDIIKVLVDSTHNNAATYYRCVENNNVKSWSYIGAEGAYYTKSEADNKFVEQTITVNGQPLSSNVTLTASDVGALPSSTTIGAGVLTIQKNGVDVDTFNANATTNKTINMTVPTDTNDLTNGAGFITSSAIGNGTVTINQGGSQKGTFTLNQSGNVTIDLDAGGGTPTNMVTTDTAQDISGRKTFLGEKAIYFKQTATSNKLGFTLYNPSNGELAALEYRPNTISGASLLALNCPQTTGGYVGFRYWGTPAVNIVAPKVATAGNYFMATHITDGSTTVTASNTGTINISTLLPDISTKQDTLVSGTNIKTINNQSILGSGNIDTSEIFIAQYGITSYTDITTAINNGKLVLCTYNGSTYYYDGSGGGLIAFTTNTVGTNYVITVDSSNNWTNDSRAFPNKTSDLTNDSGYITNSALSGYATESYVNTGLAAKQNTLVSGANIKTINNTSLLGSGNIVVADTSLSNLSTTGQNIADTVKDQNTNTRLKYWTGTKAQYDALTFDNYTVVGSPTITDDGIASGFSGSNYLSFPLNLNIRNTININIEGTHDGTQTNPGELFYISDGTNRLDLYRNRFNKMSGQIGTSGSDYQYLRDSSVTTSNASYKWIVMIDIVNNTVSYVYYENNILVFTSNAQTLTNLANINWSNVTVGRIGGQYNTLLGSIDLKQFSITVDGVEVYRAFGRPDADTLYNVEGVGLYKGSQLISGSVPNSANQSLSNLDSTGQAVIDGKVSKSGDTMTGALILDMTTVGSSNENFQDITFSLDDINRAGLRCSHLTDGTNRVQIIVRNNSGTLASGYTASNNNGTLSCSFPNTTCVDGEWKSLSYVQVINTTTSVNGSGSLPYDIKNIIPKDGYDYLVDFATEGKTGTTSGDFFNIRISSDIGGARTIVRAQTRSNSAVYAGGFCSMPVSTSRMIYLDRATNWKGEVQGLWVCGYRRLGTNN